jgi:pimeloyl-ACP methyl ester carboxylesterase
VTLVLVHGLSGSSRWWRPVVPLLERRVNVRVLDVPKYRRTFRPAVAAEWLAETIAPWAPAIVAGHSLGGLACARLAARQPELVRALVLVAPVGIPSRSLAHHVLSLGNMLRLSNSRFLALLVGDALRAGPVSLIRGAWHAVGEHLGEELEAIVAPTLLVWGRQDPLVPMEVAQEWQRRLAHSRLEVLPHAKHVPMLEAPSELAAAVDRFLSELEISA